MKEKIFNVIIYGMLGYTLAVSAYGALPAEYQNMIPFNWVTALVSAGTTGLLGSAGLMIKAYINKADEKAIERFNLLSNAYVDVVDSYKNVKSELENLKKEYKMLVGEMEQTNKLIRTDLEAKLSNDLIDQKVRELIEGVLNE